MNKYESIIILNPNLKDMEIKSIINYFKDVLINFSKDENKVKIDDLGKRKLAYEVKGNKEGYYMCSYFSAESKDIGELERLYRIKDEVIKFLVVRKEDEDYE